MANKIKDTDYLAISARVRAMETTLLTAERMERLLEARSDGEEPVAQRCRNFFGTYSSGTVQDSHLIPF